MLNSQNKCFQRHSCFSCTFHIQFFLQEKDKEITAHEHVSTQDTLALKNVSTQRTFAHEHVSTQYKLTRELVSIQGTLALEHVRHAIQQTPFQCILINLYINPRFCTYTLHRRQGHFFVVHFRIFSLNSLRDFEHFKFVGTKFQVWAHKEAIVSVTYRTGFKFLRYKRTSL